MRDAENEPVGLILCSEKKKEQFELMNLDYELISKEVTE